MGYEHRGTFVDPINLSRYLSAIDEELDGVAGAKPVILRGYLTVSEQSMLRSPMSEESLCHALEARLSAA